MLKAWRENISWWCWLFLTHAMESSVRHYMLEVPHDDQREVGVECLECSSKCEDGFFKEYWRVCGA